MIDSYRYPEVRLEDSQFGDLGLFRSDHDDCFFVFCVAFHSSITVLLNPYLLRILGTMAVQREDIATLLARVQQAGASNFQDDPSVKGELLQTLNVLQREIEGPAAYLSRVRQAVCRCKSEKPMYECAANSDMLLSLKLTCVSLWQSRWDF